MNVMLAIRPACLGAVAVAGLVVGLSAQRGPQPTFRANVDLVQVDVVVLDKDGTPVRGLTRADFTVLDRKQPQTISAFQEVSHDADPAKADDYWAADIPRDVADNSTARSERLVVLAIDDLVPSDRFARIKELARQVVSELGKNASMALLTSSEARQVEVTDNLALMLDQIDKIQMRSAYAPRVARLTGVETGTCAPRMFEQAARMLGPEDTRRKAFVYISPYCATNVAGILSSMAEDPTNALGDSSDYIRMIESMRKANVSMYAIDPRGAQDFSLGHFDAPDIMTPGRSGMDAWRTSCATRSCDPVLISQDNLRQVTAATGGFAITNTNDFHAGLARLVDDFDHYYLLGFTPADRTGKGFRPIEVTVNRPGMTLRYRRGYALGDPPALPKNKDPMVQLSAGVLPRSALALRLFASPIPSAGKATRVVVALEVRSPQARVASQLDNLDITILAVDLKKLKVSREFQRPRRVALPRQPDGAEGGVNYQIVTSVDLTPGLYQLRVSAKSSRLGTAGSVYGTVNVPDYAKMPLALGGLVVGYPDSTRHASAVTVMDADTLPLEPVLDRAFVATDELRLVADLWRRNPAKAVATTMELQDEHGRVITTMNRQEPAGRPSESRARIDVTFSLAGLAPGPYRVRLTVKDGALSDTRDIGVVVKKP